MSDDDETKPDVEPTESDEASTEAETSPDSDPSPETPRRRLGVVPVIPLALVLSLLAAGGLSRMGVFLAVPA